MDMFGQLDGKKELSSLNDEEAKKVLGDLLYSCCKWGKDITTGGLLRGMLCSSNL